MWSLSSRPLVGALPRTSAALNRARAAVVARVSSIPSRPAPADDDNLAAQAPPLQDADRIVQQLQLNVAHYTVDGASLPVDHPDHEEPRAALLIPADHPEAPEIDQRGLAVEDASIHAPSQQEQHEQQLQQEQEHDATEAHKQQHKKQQQKRQQQGARNQHGGNMPWQRHPRFGHPIEPKFAIGDTVWGEVVHNAGTGGARVRLLDHEGVIGFMPASNEPLGMTEGTRYRTSKNNPQGMSQDTLGLPVGHVRAFKVRSIPSDMTFHGKGPLLSASDADYDLAWIRAQQAFQLCKEHCETVTVTISDGNQGGLLAPFLGLKAFIPFSGLDKPAGKVCDTAAMVGKQLNVAFIECCKDRKVLTMSEKVAQTYKVLRDLKPGSLVMGTVKKVSPHMAHVKLDGVKSSLLAHMHVSKFSCGFTRKLDRYLYPDDRVLALVVDVAENYSRVELSTAHLEVEPGDMLKDPKAVYATADRQAEIVRRQMAEAAAVQATEAAAAAAEVQQEGAQEQAWCDQAQVPVEVLQY